MARWKNRQGTKDDIQQLKRDAILKAAGSAFSKRGYHNTSLDDVAKSLGISKGTLYNYVRDKQDILGEFHRISNDISDRAFEYGRSKGGTGAQVLSSILNRYILLLTAEMGACGALLEIDALKPQDRARAVKARDEFQQALVEIIETGIRDGSIRQIDPKIAVFTFMGAINWMARWYTPSGRLPGDILAELMTDLLLSGLMTQASGVTSSSGSDVQVGNTDRSDLAQPAKAI